MQALINDTNSFYVTDNTPIAEARYCARFYFDPNSITMSGNTALVIFQAYTSTGKSILQFEIRYGGGYQIRGRLLNDSSSVTNIDWVAMSDAPHYIEMDWREATPTTVHNGDLTVWVNGVQKADVSSEDNDTRRVD